MEALGWPALLERTAWAAWFPIMAWLAGPVFIALASRGATRGDLLTEAKLAFDAVDILRAATVSPAITWQVMAHHGPQYGLPFYVWESLFAWPGSVLAGEQGRIAGLRVGSAVALAAGAASMVHAWVPLRALRPLAWLTVVLGPGAGAMLLAPRPDAVVLLLLGLSAHVISRRGRVSAVAALLLGLACGTRITVFAVLPALAWGLVPPEARRRPGTIVWLSLAFAIGWALGAPFALVAPDEWWNGIVGGALYPRMPGVTPERWLVFGTKEALGSPLLAAIVVGTGLLLARAGHRLADTTSERPPARALALAGLCALAPAFAAPRFFAHYLLMGWTLLVVSAFRACATAFTTETAVEARRIATAHVLAWGLWLAVFGAPDFRVHADPSLERDGGTQVR